LRKYELGIPINRFLMSVSVCCERCFPKLKDLPSTQKVAVLCLSLVWLICGR
jgi:hypothetical protein